VAQAEQNARSYLIPAPTGGWNTRDPWYAMPETDAIILDNIFPDTNFCRKRGGAAEWADVGASTVHTLAVLALATGTEKLVAISGTDIFDASAGGAGTSIKGAVGITTGVAWQYTTFRNRLFMVNGTDAPIEWAGTGNAALTAWTGPTIANLINVASYKRRLYFVEKNTAKIWYTAAVDNVDGPLISFDVQSLLTKGGQVLYAGSTTVSTSSAPNAELFVIVSDQGEVLVYSGDNPLSGTWDLVGHYVVGKAIGRRCAFSVGGDLTLITYDGIVPLSLLLSGADQSNDYQTASGKIKSAFVDAATAYGGNASWCGAYFAAGHYIVINVPIQDYGNSYQFVQNTINKSWCRFTGYNAHSWVSWKRSAAIPEQLYYGDKTNGKIYRADSVPDLEADLSTTPIDIQHAFSSLGNGNTDKILTYLQSYLYMAQHRTVDVTTQQLQIGASFDFRAADTASLPTFTLDVGVTSVLEAAITNDQLLDATGSGKMISIRIIGNVGYTGTLLNGTKFQYYSTNVYFNEGANIA
jgi:hypothetical protein